MDCHGRDLWIAGAGGMGLPGEGALGWVGRRVGVGGGEAVFFWGLGWLGGYMARAAFVVDRSMGKICLEGRAFVALLSSYSCAIPGIMAARTVPSPRQRLVTILVAPLMTCSARLPVYTLLISAFIPRDISVGPLGIQGLALFGLYLGAVSYTHLTLPTIVLV